MRIKRTNGSPLAFGSSSLGICLAELYAMEDLLIGRRSDLLLGVREQGSQNESMRTCSYYQHVQHLSKHRQGNNENVSHVYISKKHFHNRNVIFSVHI